MKVPERYDNASDAAAYKPVVDRVVDKMNAKGPHVRAEILAIITVNKDSKSAARLKLLNLFSGEPEASVAEESITQTLFDNELLVD